MCQNYNSRSFVTVGPYFYSSAKIYVQLFFISAVLTISIYYLYIREKSKKKIFNDGPIKLVVYASIDKSCFRLSYLFTLLVRYISLSFISHHHVRSELCFLKIIPNTNPALYISHVVDN